MTILEIKVQDAMPLWLCEILSAGNIRKGSFPNTEKHTAGSL
jgi:hypothetical protein